jgi:dTMP kinase
VTKGRFIVVDGTDGSGKSSAVAYLEERLSEDHTVFLTEESTMGTICSFVKRAFKRGKLTDAWTLVSLFIADRVAHRLEIQTALSEGKMVICDRYMYSGIAFGTYDICRNIPGSKKSDVRRRLLALHKALPIPIPDIALVMSVPAKIAVQRIQIRKTFELIEAFETEEAIRNVRREFHTLKRSGAFTEMKIIDNSGTKTTTFRRIWDAVTLILP